MSRDEELRWVRRREGTHRSSSKATPGYERDLLREDGTEQLLGPTESRPADIDQIVRSRRPSAFVPPSPGQEFRYQLGDIIMGALEPHLRRGADATVDAAVRGIAKLWRWAVSRPAQRSTVAADPAEGEAADGEAAALPIADFAGLGDESSAVALEAQEMTAERYKALLLSALLADQYAARARRILANVRVHDEALPIELESAIRAALSGPTAVVDDATLAQVVELLRDSAVAEGEFLLVPADQVDQPSRSLAVGPTPELEE